MGLPVFSTLYPVVFTDSCEEVRVMVPGGVVLLPVLSISR